MTDLLRKTPLNEFHKRQSGRMVPFAGWEMPVQYTSILEEHRAVREAAGLFDVSHMGECTVKGNEAKVFLDYLLTNDLSLLNKGKVLYSCMCYEDGGVVDDLLVYERSKEDFLLCINAGNTDKDIEWISDQAVGFDCEVKNVSTEWAQLAVQGPKAIEIVKRVVGDEISELERFRFIDIVLNGHRSIISRTGYTGEDGVEIYIRPDHATELAEEIFEVGKPDGLMLAGLGCRDSLRLEAGFPLYGHEISSEIDPLSGGLGWVVKLNKAVPFIGDKALREIKKNGPQKKVVFFRVNDRRIARQDTPVVNAEGRIVGKVVSGTMSPMQSESIGSALVDTSAKDSSLFVEIRGKQIPITQAKPPLHKQ